MLLGGLPNHQTTPINTTTMSKKRHTKEAQIKAIRDHESGRSQAEICKELNITAQTFYRWKKQLGMMTNPDVRRLKELEKENKELKQMLADGLLRERILKIVVEKNSEPEGPAGAAAGGHGGYAMLAAVRLQDPRAAKEHGTLPPAPTGAVRTAGGRPAGNLRPPSPAGGTAR